MKGRWGWLVVPCLVTTGTLLLASQAVFLRISLYRDRGFGRVEPDVTLANYVRVLQDPFYLQSLALTFEVAIAVLVCSLLCGCPAAYILARMRSRWAPLLLGALIASALVAEIIKVLGLVVIFSADGVLNRSLLASGLIDAPLRLLGTVPGVVIGLLHFTLGFVILLMFGVFQTIPRSLEEAARVHGASRLRALWRIVLPLSRPGMVAAGLVVFNLSMGSFTAAALLGGGRILTMPVLIERTMVLETRYAIAACVAAVLMGSVLLVNVAASVVLTRRRAGAPA
jgi:putative spermidine/putrescine transport system permease protein